MIVEFDKSFIKSVNKLQNETVAANVSRTIANIENAETTSDIRNLKKLVGYKEYYRIRIGDFRIGLKRVNSTTFRFIAVANRRDIYKRFP